MELNQKDCFTNPDQNVPAYKDISNGMLPETSMRRSQETLLSKFRTLMKCLIGSTPSHFITRDVTTAFILCWKRLQFVCEFPDSTVGDAAITVYGKIPRAKIAQLQLHPNDIFCCRSRVTATCKWFRSSSDRSAYGRC